MSVFIQGLRGVGLETAKNLILAGPKRVTICDDTLISMNDLATNFFANENDVGKVKRSKCVIKQLQELNPYVKVDIYEGKVDEHAI